MPSGASRDGRGVKTTLSQQLATAKGENYGIEVL